MAARLGLEPRQSESESLVLPLHHQAVGSSQKVEPAMGFEPATACLQNRCSTIELRRQRPVVSQRAGLSSGGFSLDLEKTRGGAGGSPGTRTPNLLIKSQLLYH